MRIFKVNKVNTLLVGLMMMVILLSFSSQAQAGAGGGAYYTYGYYQYDITAAEVAVITDYTGAGGAVTIPSILGERPDLRRSVTSIDSYAFYNCTGITTISIPQGVTSIGKRAFIGCNNLSSIKFNSATTTINDDVYTIPASTKIIGYNPSTAKNYATKYNRAFEVIGTTNTLQSIAITSPATKLSYAIGDTLDISGLVLTGTYSDGSTRVEYITTGNITGFNSAVAKTDQKLTITVGGKTTTFKVQVVAANANTDYTYTVTDGKAQITGYTGAGGAVIIPSTLGGYPVTSIDSYAFIRPYITSISIPQGVTSIGSGAFMYCSSLTSISIPQGVTSIGDSAFGGCSSLTSINIPQGVTSIGKYAFGGCSSLTSINIPQGVTSIGQSAFYDCISLTSINVVSNNLNYTSINGVLYNKAGTILISCPGGLTSISIPEGVTSIGDSAFAYCRGLTSISIPKSVTSIGNYAFQKCTGLTSISISQGVTSIGENAFDGCSSLKSINIPQGVTSIDGYTFRYCAVLNSITVAVNNLNYTSIGGVLYNKAGTILIACPRALTSISIPLGVRSIGEGAFADCSGLTSISIPEGVTSIGYGAFWGCGNLTSINIPQGVTKISSNAFFGCSSLKSISIPQGITSIDYGAFTYCSNLTSISIPQGVTSIGEDAFFGCTCLTSISVAANNLNYTSIDGVLYNKAGTSLIACPAGLASVSIPQGVTSIPDYAFFGCTGLTSISLPQGVTSIGRGAFRDCTSLINISIPQGVTSIGDYTFLDCTGLTSISLPQGVTSIGTGAFENCIGLTSISIPQGVTSIDFGAFSGCTGLTSISIPQGVTSIGYWAFANCTGLTSITFNSATTTIGDDSDTIPVATKIIGYNPSTAKDYATKYNRTFEVIVPTIVLPAKGTLDKPATGTTVSGIIPVSGWFLDGAGVKTIEVLVDNILKGSATYGSVRTDVYNAYPLYNNKNSGYTYGLDTTKITNGTHTLTIRETASNDVKTTLPTRNIIVNNLPIKYSLDKPANLTKISGITSISGWFLGGTGLSKVEVYVDDILKGNATLNTTRTDVYNAYPLYNNKNAGFSYSLDVNKLSYGTHTITVKATTTNNVVTTLGTRTVTALPAKGAIDKPVVNANVSALIALPVSGWFLDGSGVSKIEVYLDNVFKGTASINLPRTDVNTAFPLYSNPNSGYSCNISIAGLTTGTHTITVKETGKTGIVTSLARSIVK